MSRPSRSFESSPHVTVEAERGQLVHGAALEHSARLERRMYEPCPGVWCLVGNGLSNQTFVKGPEGIIAIDTGESVEEMASALEELRRHTDDAVVSVIYTHFHYAAGTTAIGADVEVYGHSGIAGNLARVTSEIGPTYASGLVHQFGITLPDEGPDGLVNVGLGNAYHSSDHAPFTPGHVPITRSLEDGERLSIAGLTIEVTHSPSDADDSITLWFPDLGVCVQNIVWPVLFNIFAIRGEEYRDPRVVLAGIDHVLSLGAEHLVGTHGPPLSGGAEIQQRVVRYRDSIQFLWDQTVRSMNRGLTDDEIAETVRLPDECDDDYLTSEFYGVAEHHVRQIAAGVRGWFDGDPAKLFPLERSERAARIVEGFGGVEEVRRRCSEALEHDDLRWAIELASWLACMPDGSATDQQLLARALRAVAQRTTAANIRNWCLTRARHLDGTSDLGWFRTHRLRPDQILAVGPSRSVQLIRVLLDPLRAAGVDTHIALRFDGTAPVGLHVRNGVACATDGVGASIAADLSLGDWAEILGGKARWNDLVDTGRVRIEGDPDLVGRVLDCFDIDGLRAVG